MIFQYIFTMEVFMSGFMSITAAGSVSGTPETSPADLDAS